MKASLCFAIGALALAACSRSGSVPSAGEVPAASTAGLPLAAPSLSKAASPTPTPAATMLFASDDAGGITQFNAATGEVERSFAPSLAVSQVGVDDAGSLYAFGTGAAPVYDKVSPQGTVLASYEPTTTTQDAFDVSPAGAVVISGTVGTGASERSVYDVWDPGTTGKPSRTLKYPMFTGYLPTFTIARNGDLYIPYQDAGVEKFDVITPKHGKPSKTIVDGVAPSPATYAPGWMAAASDGTLYVGEWAGRVPDADAGLYVYPPSGPQKLLTNLDQGINGMELDAAQNLYVASNDTTFDGSAYTADTAHQFSVYSPHAAALLRQFDDRAPGVASITVGQDGTAYLTRYAGFGSNAPATGDVFRIAAGSSTATRLIQKENTGNVGLYDGSAGDDVVRGVR